MAKIYTTEITSEQITSDNPIHQRLFKAYVVAREYVFGDVLEVGCGEGRGIAELIDRCQSYTAVDKIASAIEALQRKYPTGKFISMNIPPLAELKSDEYDIVVSFQVIEHIRNDKLFLQEIHRVLKPGGVALITTPNKKLSLSRNPWHIREYFSHELESLARSVFRDVTMKGISGNEKVMAYYEENKRSVQKLMKWDVFNLQYLLPAPILKIPYEIFNRWNRNSLQSSDNKLVSDIQHSDYVVTNDAANSLDLFLIAKK